LQPFANGNGSTVFTRLKGQKRLAARGGRIRPDECLRSIKVKRQAIFALDQALATNVQKGSGKGWHQELRLLD